MLHNHISLDNLIIDSQPKYVDHGTSCLLELFSKKDAQGPLAIKPFRSSTWVFYDENVRSVRNSGGCCWDVFSSSR